MLRSRPLFKITLSLLGTLALLAIIVSGQPIHPSQAAGGCQVVYTPNQWNTGFTADVKIINNDTAAINGWTLTWSFANGQQITSSWNATVTQSGANVTAGAPAGHWNGTIGANGGSVSFGFQATHTGANTTPTDFVLNGVVCNGGSTATDTPTATSTIPAATNTPTPTTTTGDLPDLTVSAIQYDGGTPSGCEIPPDMGTRVYISNIGNANAEPFVVTLNNLLSANVSGLAAGAETSVLFAGYNVMQNTAIVDPDDLINEISEDNNQLSATLPVPTPPPTCTPTASPPPTGGCRVNYTTSQWNTGFTADVEVINNGTAAINGWTLTWSFANGQQITSSWNATVAQSGANVTANDLGWNGTIRANGGSVSFGFQATHTGVNATPTDFTLNGIACSGNDTPTNTPTPTLTLPTRTPGPTPTTGPEPIYTGNATYFDALGMPYGGCGITQSALDSQHFVALNVQDTPGDYSTMLSRPIAPEYADKIGMFNNGLNCGRWVRVTIGDYCNGINDGAPGAGFCHDGTGWVSDEYNGATLNMLVADSCQDGNGWCRDDPYHLDLAKASLNLFEKDGQPIGDMYPDNWNNRQVSWQFIEAPNYTGDIEIGFLKDAQIWWTAIAITHLRNGIHGLDYYENGAWVSAVMNADMGQSYIIRPTTAGGSTYRIRVYDVNDQLINSGRIYNFSFPTSCGSQCSSEFTPVTYTVE
ncbi:MAG: cellulose binding domain-containing protein [Anaerolineae bacterium]|nr:cellulose binding domain-containing protein [Anaerolineae bacterium]